MPLGGPRVEITNEHVGVMAALAVLVGGAWRVVSRLSRTDRQISDNAEAIRALTKDMQNLRHTQKQHEVELALLRQSATASTTGIAEIKTDLKLGLEKIHERLDRWMEGKK